MIRRAIEELIFWGVIVFFALACISFVYLVFIWAPVGLYAQAECLRKGYPKYEVTVGLERYCMTLDGAVTVRVDKAGK